MLTVALVLGTGTVLATSADAGRGEAVWVSVGNGLAAPERTPPPTPPTTPRPVAPKIGHHVSGKASWYCSVEKPICHHRYPPGSMVAAACASLRRAMGPSWRGRVVTVGSASHVVTVRLVDWCGSKTKLIDLYRAPMARLGGSGTLPVTVSW